MRDNLRTDLRKVRAEQITAQIIQIASKYVSSDDRRNLHRFSKELRELFYDAGAEIVTDYTRREAGLPPRGPDGWTDDELRALEQRRMEMLTKPIQHFMPREKT